MIIIWPPPTTPNRSPASTDCMGRELDVWCNYDPALKGHNSQDGSRDSYSNNVLPGTLQPRHDSPAWRDNILSFCYPRIFWIFIGPQPLTKYILWSNYHDNEFYLTFIIYLTLACLKMQCYSQLGFVFWDDIHFSFSGRARFIFMDVTDLLTRVFYEFRITKTNTRHGERARY